MPYSNPIPYGSSIAVVIFFLSFAPANASAQSAEQLTRADSNSDGQISWQEVVDLRATTFERLDRNKDGFIDEDDSPRMGPAKRRFAVALEKLEDMDADGNGRISREELLEAPAPNFTAADANGDDVLSKEELADLR